MGGGEADLAWKARLAGKRLLAGLTPPPREKGHFGFSNPKIYLIFEAFTILRQKNSVITTSTKCSVSGKVKWNVSGYCIAWPLNTKVSKSVETSIHSQRCSSFSHKNTGDEGSLYKNLLKFWIKPGSAVLFWCFRGQYMFLHGLSSQISPRRLVFLLNLIYKISCT